MNTFSSRASPVAASADSKRKKVINGNNILNIFLSSMNNNLKKLSYNDNNNNNYSYMYCILLYFTFYCFIFFHDSLTTAASKIRKSSEWE